MRDRLDPLIAERAPWLFAPHPLTRAVRSVAEYILRYRETVELAHRFRDMPMPEIMAALTDRIAQNVRITGLRHIPQSGPALVVANHPTGIADGIILYHAFARSRPDLFIFANSDILRVLPQMRNLILPVEWRLDRRNYEKTKKTMQLTGTALSDGRLGIIFPSGRLAKRRQLHLYERAWMQSAVMIAQKFDVPIIPVNIQARNSVLFYLLDLLHPTLRDITLFHETLNKDRQPFRVHISAPVLARDLPAKRSDAIEFLRRRTLSLGQNATGGVSLVKCSASYHAILETS
ncbi:1-acyl-sn-glycerol-3-phosphate acyltransferase [uncultured Roseobacter sp.]|uniref:1-acyl-sn-glycerol-3-phosphate acyltransferase n=1 Tax=uncultured Roseobacter sp. TaxID=114847 RepID=UPI002624BE15|nr:1-acyl-sn-glycerol-3-phosphate acyltransferase [uncultured Roseobacter sp.]